MPETLQPQQSAEPNDGWIHGVTLLRNRSLPMQILLGGVIPAALGALAGIMLGISTAAYWAVGAVAAVGGFVAGFEHQDGWGGADRGMVGGAIYGAALLIAHKLAGTHAKVSLGSFPPFLIVITAILGILLGAAGGRIARGLREHDGIYLTREPPDE
jgi:hypothetical protein